MEYSFTYGTTPHEAVVDRFDAVMADSSRPYHITLSAGDSVLSDVVPSTIDSGDEMVEVLTALAELSERASSFRSALLETLGIEEI